MARVLYGGFICSLLIPFECMKSIVAFITSERTYYHNAQKVVNDIMCCQVLEHEYTYEHNLS